MNPAPSVAVVVPTRNSGRTVAACLRSVLEQDTPAVQILVVDNHSDDDTVRIAEGLGVPVMTAGPERSAQRNYGWRLTSSDLVFFMDSDMVLEPAVVAEAAQVMASDPSVGAVVIPERAFGTGFLADCRALEKELYLGNAAVEAARVFRREALVAVGGYDEALTACEDWDLADRIAAAGWETRRTSAQVWHDEGQIRLRASFAKKQYYGSWYRRYRITRTAHAPGRPIGGRFGAAQLRHAGRSPLRATGLALLKATEAAGFALGSVRHRDPSAT